MFDIFNTTVTLPSCSWIPSPNVAKSFVFCAMVWSVRCESNSFVAFVELSCCSLSRDIRSNLLTTTAPSSCPEPEPAEPADPPEAFLRFLASTKALCSAPDKSERDKPERGSLPGSSAPGLPWNRASALATTPVFAGWMICWLPLDIVINFTIRIASVGVAG